MPEENLACRVVPSGWDEQELWRLQTTPKGLLGVCALLGAEGTVREGVGEDTFFRPCRMKFEGIFLSLEGSNCGSCQNNSVLCTMVKLVPGGKRKEGVSACKEALVQ